MPQPSLPLLLEIEQYRELASPQAQLLIDVSSPENYANGHIPGALHLHPGYLQCGIAPAPGRLPAAAQLAEVLSALGLTSEKHVIAYDDEGGGWAARFLWTLEAVGHTHYSYLNGGIHAWRAAGMDIETTPNQPLPSDFEVSINRAPIAEIDDILPRLEDRNFAIWGGSHSA